MDLTLNEQSAPMAVEKIKILGAILELPAKWHYQSSLFTSKLGQIGQSSQNLIFFLIAMGANYSSYVKSIPTYAPTFFVYIISF